MEIMKETKQMEKDKEKVRAGRVREDERVKEECV